MKKIIGKQDLIEMAYGSCLMGGGGGGSLQNGTDIIESFAAEGEIAIEFISLDEMKEGSFCCFCAGFGSPLRFKERGANCINEPMNAFRAVERQSLNMNRKVEYIMPVEYGALNSILPMMVAMKCGVPVLDADGTGRAVPSLQSLLYGVNNVPIGPFCMADSANNVTISYPDNCYDAPYLDRLGRHICQASDMVMGVAGGICTRQEVESKLVANAYTYAQMVGKTLLNATANKLDYVQELKKIMECRELFKGKIQKFDAIAERGWDFGFVHCQGAGEYEGKKFRIDYQNESLVCWEGDKVLLTVPDLICVLNLDTGEPMSNADLKEGMNIVCIAIPAPANWFISESGVKCWHTHFEAISYTGDIVRY